MQYVIFGDYMITAWYHSPLPPPFDKAERLYVCPYSIKYFRKRRLLQRHLDVLPSQDRHPPGVRVYHSPPAGRQYRLSTAAKPSLTAACDPPVRPSLSQALPSLCAQCMLVATRNATQLCMSLDMHGHADVYVC
jgi:hypothetical protein